MHLALLALLTHAASAAVFEADLRRDFYEIQDPVVQTLAKSVFTFVPKENLIQRPDGKFEFRLRRSLKDALGLCAGEHFGEQPSVGTRCTGFLVAPDLGVTAGHCVSPEVVADFCRNYFVVFDYRMTAHGEASSVLPASSVYECSRIEKLVFDPEKDTDDYAILRLSKPVTDRKPLAYRKQGRIGDREGVFMLGYPRGLPEKISPSRFVTDNRDNSSFSADLDCFHGNSGSPVFNSKTLEVEGIFVRGKGYFPGSSTEPAMIGDFFYDNARRCYRTLVCKRSEGCNGTMDSTRITRVGLP